MNTQLKELSWQLYHLISGIINFFFFSNSHKKLVLFLRAMFSGNLRFLESEQSKITLHDIDSTILKQILNFIYTAEIQVLYLLGQGKSIVPFLFYS